MQDLRTKRYVAFSFHLHLVFIYILVYILALLLEMSKSLSRLLSGTSPGIYANYYKISIYLKKNFMSLYPAPEESGFYGHVDNNAPLLKLPLKSRLPSGSQMDFSPSSRLFS